MQKRTGTAWVRGSLVGLAVAWATLAGAIELDERPAEAGDWGFRPEDGTTPAQNPPAFTWRPVKGAAAYEIEVAIDPEFEFTAYQAEAIPWSAHCPSMAFPAMTFYWRYAARDAQGNRSPWSRGRSFTVAADAPQIPKPTIGELRARMSEQHPRLFFRSEDLPRLRELAQGPLAERWQALVKQADKLLASPPDASDPPKYPEGTVRLSAEWKKIWWGNRLRTIDVANAAATLGFVYQITGDEKYARAARELLLAMAGWDPEGATNYEYNDEAAMPALYLPSRAYTWIYPVLSEDDRHNIAAAMRIRGRQAFDHLHRRQNHLWRPYASHSNRAWHKLGELAIAFQGEIPEADEWLDYAMTVFYTVYPVWGDPDGGWHEGVSYWASYTGRFMWWAEAARSAFGIDVFERPFYKRVGYFPMYVLPPGSKTGGFGDQSEGMGSAGVADVVAILAAGAQNPHWKWYADRTGGDLGDGYLGFLFAARAGDLKGQAPTDLPSSACFRGTGVAVLNSNLLDGTQNVQVHFKSSPMGTQSHGFNSNNSFLLNIGGQRAFLSSGKRDVHGSPHHTQWMWETKSGNGILVNGQGQKKHSAESTGRITAFATSETVDVVEGETQDADSGLTRWRRRIVFLKPDVIVMHDVLDAAQPSSFQWLLHAPGAFDIGDNAVDWSGTNGRAQVRFLEPAGLQIAQKDTFDVPPAEWTGWNLGEWHLTADAPEKVAHREFVTVITVNGAQADAQLVAEADSKTLLIRRADGETRLRLGADAFAVEAPGFTGKY